MRTSTRTHANMNTDKHYTEIQKNKLNKGLWQSLQTHTELPGGIIMVNIMQEMPLTVRDFHQNTTSQYTLYQLTCHLWALLCSFLHTWMAGSWCFSLHNPRLCILLQKCDQIWLGENKTCLEKGTRCLAIT